MFSAPEDDFYARLAPTGKPLLRPAEECQVSDFFLVVADGHMVNTNCSSSHNRKALCCKMSVEFDTFLNTDKK